VLAWHDMFVQMVVDDLKISGVTEVLEPVIWSYAEDLDSYIAPTVWDSLKPFRCAKNYVTNIPIYYFILLEMCGAQQPLREQMGRCDSGILYCYKFFHSKKLRLSFSNFYYIIMYIYILIFIIL
jgi:hypothetical protein